MSRPNPTLLAIALLSRENHSFHRSSARGSILSTDRGLPGEPDCFIWTAARSHSDYGVRLFQSYGGILPALVSGGSARCTLLPIASLDFRAGARPQEIGGVPGNHGNIAVRFIAFYFVTVFCRERKSLGDSQA